MTKAERDALFERALAIWPRLDRRRLTRTGGDPRKVAHLVATRTAHTEETIIRLLARPEGS